MEADIEVENQGTIFVFTPLTDKGETWLKEHLEAEAQWLGKSVAVEHRYAKDIAVGAIQDGLIVE